MPDDYLDRLDQAFAALKASSRQGARARPPLPDDDWSQGPELPVPTAPPAPPPDRATAPPAALDQAVAAVPLIPSALVEEVTRLVIERLADQEVRRIVLDTAERLVRAEIELIKRART